MFFRRTFLNSQLCTRKRKIFQGDIHTAQEQKNAKKIWEWVEIKKADKKVGREYDGKGCKTV